MAPLDFPFPPTTDGQWTQEQTLSAFSNSLFPGEIIALFLNLVGVIAFYSFKNQRKFPASILAWIGFENIFYCSYLVAKWTTSGSAFQFLVVNAAGGTSGCSLGLFVDAFNSYVIVGLNTLVSITLYCSIIHHLDLSVRHDPRYRRYFLIFLLAFASVIPFIVTVYAASQTAGSGVNVGFCTAGVLTLFQAIPLLLFLAAQIFLIGRVLSKSRVIIQAAQSTNRTSRDIRMVYLLVRCIGMIISEILVFSGNAFAALIVYQGSALTPPELKWVLLGAILGPCLDGAVLIFGNRALTRWLFEKVSGISQSQSSSDDKTMKEGKSSLTSGSVGASTSSPVEMV